MRKSNLALVALGFGVTSLYLFARKAATKKSADEGTKLAGDFARAPSAESNVVIDDHGTNQVEAAKILKNIRDAGFDASNERLALVLGRPTEEIEAWASGFGVIDGDVVMKARHLAMERGIQFE
jgi:hypothetical protein